MKRFIISIFAIFCVANLFAQEVTPEQSGPVQMNLSSFDAIDVNAPIKLKLIKIDKSETPYIIYDTKGVYTSKFTVEVDREGVLKIRERYDPKRVGATEVKLFYNTLDDIKLSRADAVFEGTLKTSIVDIVLSNGAQLIANIDVKDIKIRISGECRVELTGHTLYQDADVATAKYNAIGLESVSTIVRAEHNAEVKVDATERLEAKSTTGGKIFYKSTPDILRTEKSLFGVDIQQLK